MFRLPQATGSIRVLSAMRHLATRHPATRLFSAEHKALGLSEELSENPSTGDSAATGDDRASRHEPRVVAVAGGTRGLGGTIARAFVELGASLSICGRNGADVAEAVAELGRPSTEVWGRPADVTVRGEVEMWLDEGADRLGRIDVLVANVGGNRDPEYWEEVFGDNLFWVVRALDWAERNLADGGAVVLVSSVAAHLPQLSRSEAAYGASKAALEHLTRHAAARLGARGIRVNAVAPGPLARGEGEWMADLDSERALIDSLQAASSLGRFATSEEVASCVTFLASRQAGAVTGCVLRCDAGLEAHLP